MKQQLGFADDEISLRLLALSRRDKLVKLHNIIDWESFRPTLQRALKRTPKGPGGRPPIDPLVKFKMLVIQRLYDLSDDELEFQVSDRITFRAFVGLHLMDDAPDAKTIWEFREKLQQRGVLKTIWDQFMGVLDSKGLIANKGRIIDAEIVESERRHMHTDEQDRARKNKDASPEEQEPVVENPHRDAQIDLEAGWTKKHGKTYFGYKNTAKVDADSKLIVDYAVDSAAVHDSQTFEAVLDRKRDRGTEIFADKGYAGMNCTFAANEVAGPRKARIMHKAYRNKALTDSQKEENKHWAKTRARVEHVFGWRKYTMGQGRLRTIGKVRAEFTIGLGNLLYNLFRCCFLERPKIPSGV